MKIEMRVDDFSPLEPVRVGNVYPIKGGRGLREGHMQILLAITEPHNCHGASCLFLVVNKDGQPRGVNSYGLHYVQELMPMAFVDGIDELSLVMRSI